jgi:signal transduction histidine kinase
MTHRTRRLPGALFWIPGVLVAGIVWSVALFIHLRQREHRDASIAAADLAHQQIERLRISILRSMEVLHSVDALHAAHGHLDRQHFGAFVQSALGRQPELQALSWNPTVPHARRMELEAAARADGLEGFTFREALPNGEFQPAQSRPAYVPVYFIEPFAPNQAALGFDLASDPSRRASLERARDSGLPIASAPIRLAQGPEHTAGFLVLLPVFERPTPHDVAQRRQQLAGFAVAVFRVDALVGDAFRELDRAGIRAELYDDSPEGERIFSLAPPSQPALRTGTMAWLEIAERRWAVVFTPTADFSANRSSKTSGLVLAIGLAFTLSTCGHLAHAGRRAREISRANTALQEEVVIRQRAEAAAATANKAKSDFLTSMSHEIRTPLNAILGYTQLMRRDSHLAPDQRDATLGIQTSGQHLLGLINEVLDLAKIEAGRMDLVPSDFDLGQLAASIATTFRPLCFQKRLAFRLELAPLPSHRVHGDEGKLRQILINLVGNAIKFTRVGEVQLHIRPLNEPQQHWLFEVLDTGLGIPESEQQDIFKPFHQGSGAGHQGGTGLGLAIAQRQVQFLGGTLQFQSERGVGSRFYFSLPLPPACLAFPSLVSELSRQEAGPDSADPDPTSIPFPSSQTILLPRELAARLALAAELHSSTALKACLPELRELGPEASRFADELRWLLRSYDMQGVQSALARVQIAPSAA